MSIKWGVNLLLVLVKIFIRKYFFKNIIFINSDNSYNQMYYNNFFYYIFIKLDKFLYNNNFSFNNFFFCLNNYYSYFHFLIKYFDYFFFIHFFSKIFFSRFIFFVSVGLGFKRKKKIRKKKKYLELYIGNRHRVLCRLENLTYLFLLRRSAIYLFSNLKKKIYSVLNKFRSAKKEISFKIKGFFFFRFKMNKALSRTWAFARRIRFKKIKTKLSKKQKLL